jgi:hypothetical protein
MAAAGLAAALLLLPFDTSRPADDRSSPPAPGRLTAEELSAWRSLPASHGAIPVLVYHGIGEPSEFTNAGDSAYGLSRDDFARQMALLDAGGFEAISLQAFQRFHAGERVRLPARPLLLTFDDARADSYQGADSVLEELGWQATMFVDVGAVTRRDRVYSTWDAASHAAQRALGAPAPQRTRAPQYPLRDGFRA